MTKHVLAARNSRRLVFDATRWLRWLPPLLLLCAANAHAQDDPKYDAKGFSQNRDTFNQFSWEHIDPLTGNLLLTFTDLILPGNAGFDVHITRTYNSKGTSTGTLGFGWSIGFGKVYHSPGSVAVGDPRPTPLIEWADGSVHECYYTGQSAGHCITQDLWQYDDFTHVLEQPNGMRYEYGFVPSSGADGPWGPIRWVSRISDQFGNSVDITYNGVTVSPGPGITSITQHIGLTQARIVGFTYNSFGMLETMTAFGRTWHYDHNVDTFHLSGVRPPDGGAWSFGYQGPQGQLTSVGTPLGGAIAYTYAIVTIADPIEDRVVHNVLVVTNRTIGGRDAPTGSWGFDYDNFGRTTVRGPQGISIRYEHTGFLYTGGLLLAVKRFERQGAVDVQVQSEELHWEQKAALGSAGTASGPTVQQPLVMWRQVVRDGKLLRTDNAYHDANYNDFGQPYLVEENLQPGTGTRRTTERSYLHLTTRYIHGLLLSDKVTIPGALPLEITYGYDLNTGFRTKVTKYGIATTYTATPQGNVATETSGSGRVTRYGYDWGGVSLIQKGETTVTRQINPDGTVQWEKVGRRTTQFEYDNVGRITLKTPPAGNATRTSYDDAIGKATVERGKSRSVKIVDGFGRPISLTTGGQTTAAIAIYTQYDAYGRPTRISLPTDLAVGNPETPWVENTYDANGRVLVRTNPDRSQTIFGYEADEIDIFENGHWRAHVLERFGQHDDNRLAALVDAEGQTWHYSYNAAGKVAKVIAPDGKIREWVYDDPNRPDLLMRETHPESETVYYDEYDAAGNLKKKHDAKGTIFTYRYDGNDRLKAVTAGDKQTVIEYERDTDNRTVVAVDGVTTIFGYDDGGRVASRTDAVDLGPIQQIFDYDDNDNLSKITYASRREIRYDYDDENRITGVRDIGAGRDIATRFQYHPSGAVQSFFSGNGILNRFEYDSKRYWPTAVSASELNLVYADYDTVGNVGAIFDSRSNMSQSFRYDNLDRLRIANGPYGSIEFRYDVHGNRTTTQSGTYSYFQDRLRLQSNGIDSFEYDHNGNTITRSGAHPAAFTYAPDNTLVTADTPGGSVQYAYDGDGWRIKKTVGGEPLYYLRGPHGELLSELSNINKPTDMISRDYIYAGSRLLASVRSPIGLNGSFGVTFSLSEPELTFPRSGGSKDVTVFTRPLSARWTVTGLPSWLHGASSGIGSPKGTTYTLTADPNRTHQLRQGVITIAGVNLPVKQEFGEKGELLPGAVLYPGDRVWSDNDLYFLEYQLEDGNLVLRMANCNWVLWDAHQSTTHPGKVVWDYDGRFQMYDANDNWMWVSDNEPSWGARALVQNDGNLVIYSADNEIVWATYTEQFPAAHKDTMYDRERLEDLISENGLYKLSHGCQPGNVTLTRVADDHLLWPPANDPIQAGGPVVLMDGNWSFFNTHEIPRYKVRMDFSGPRPAVKLVVQNDGNIVMKDASDVAVWDSGTQQIPFATGDKIMPNQQLGLLTSQNGKFQFAHDLNTGRIFYKRLEDDVMIWPVDQPIAGLGPAMMKDDGRFILYAQPQNFQQWTFMAPSNGQEHANSHLLLQNDGNIVIEDPNGAVTWDLGYVDYPKVTSGNTVYVGEQVWALKSADGRYQFKHQYGKLLLYKTSDLEHEIWPGPDDIPIIGDGPAALLPTGDLVMYDRIAIPRHITWSSSEPAAHPNAHLTLENNGGVALYDANGQFYDYVVRPYENPAAQGDTMYPNQHLEVLKSANGLIQLTHLPNGNVELRGEGQWLWDSQTAGLGLGPAVLQTDGFFVIFSADRQWNRHYPESMSSYHVRPNAKLQVQGDGNLVLSDGAEILWDTKTHYEKAPPPPPVATGDKLYRGEQLGELWSPSHRFLFVHQHEDGNIVLYDTCKGIPGEYLWNSGTDWAGGSSIARLRINGTLELVATNGRQLWSTDEPDQPGTYGDEYLQVQDDGNAVLLSGPGGWPLWAASWDPRFHWPPVNCDAQPPPPDPEDNNADVRLNGGDNLGTMTSPNGHWQLVFDSAEGNVILYNDGNRVWDMGASGGFRATMQTDGNFVVYADGGNSHPLKWVNNGGHEGEGWFLRLTNDGRLELCNGSGQPMWDRSMPVH